jgi:hypothetical protein
MLVEDYMRQLQQRGADDSYELLTSREREVLQLLAEGIETPGMPNFLLSPSPLLQVGPRQIHRAHRLLLPQRLCHHVITTCVDHLVPKILIVHR